MSRTKYDWQLVNSAGLAVPLTAYLPSDGSSASNPALLDLGWAATDGAVTWKLEFTNHDDLWNADFGAW